MRWFEENVEKDFSPSEVVPVDVKQYREYLKRGKKPATVNKALAALRYFFSWAAASGFTSNNPASGVGFLPVMRGAPLWLDRKEQYRFVRTAQSESKRDYALGMSFLHAGLRVSEASNLRLDDVELSERKGFYFVRYSKQEKSRKVPLNKDLRLALQEYLKEHDSDSPWLFFSQRSPKMSVRAMEYVIDKIGYKAKIEGLTCHRLRHTFAHNLAAGQNPVSLDQIAMLLGHFTKSGAPNIRSTVIYTQPGDNDLIEAVERIAWD